MPRQPIRTRRQFIREASLLTGGVVLLGSCTSSGEDTGAGFQSTNDAGAIELVRLFSSDTVIAAGIEQRLPFGLVDNGAPLLEDGGPVPVRVLLDGQVIDELDVPSRLVLHDHPDGDGSTPHEHADIVRYFPLRTTLPEPGIFDVVATIDGTEVSFPVQAFAVEDIDLILPGETFPLLETPTTAAPAPMDPLCTLFDGPCPFHDRSVSEVLTAGEPMAFLIATPAFCATSYCGPVLEELIAAAGKFPSITPIHLEVYENPSEVGGDIRSPDIRAVQAFADLGLTFEPALFLVGRDGVLAERIDNVFDQSELELALARIA